jgi:hypothetical protein
MGAQEAKVVEAAPSQMSNNNAKRSCGAAWKSSLARELASSEDCRGWGEQGEGRRERREGGGGDREEAERGRESGAF